MDHCLNCNQPIRLIRYAMGAQWMHVDPAAAFPTERKGTAWRHCRGKVAEPTSTDEDGA